MSHLEDALDLAVRVASWNIMGTETSLTDVYNAIGSLFV
jgi:hypothetical protein